MLQGLLRSRPLQLVPAKQITDKGPCSTRHAEAGPRAGEARLRQPNDDGHCHGLVGLLSRLVRELAKEHCIGRHAQGPDIGLRPARLVHADLRGHEGCRAVDARRPLCAQVDNLRKAEVAKLDGDVGFGAQEVVRLDVAVDDANFMDVPQGLQHLGEDAGVRLLVWLHAAFQSLKQAERAVLQNDVSKGSLQEGPLHLHTVGMLAHLLQDVNLSLDKLQVLGADVCRVVQVLVIVVDPQVPDLHAVPGVLVRQPVRQVHLCKVATPKLSSDLILFVKRPVLLTGIGVVLLPLVATDLLTVH
mmetsp:Transcript_11114/g.25282  ORF Transcript_11114/g.25282 Transcript_11114/m.25282 type:complete len:301 (+) Transcript_11114:656-1558(+)